MRRVIIAGNWKLNKTIREAIDFATLLKREVYQVADAVIVVCPPFTALAELAEVLTDSNIKLGGQDMHWDDSGAITGEVSAPLLKDAGCEYVIIGHSERRQFFSETNETVNKKTKAALRAGLTPIVCCGELLQQREQGKTEQVLKDHITGAFRDITAEDARKTVIAYEPVWAIGTGKVATPAQAQEAHAFIRSLLAKLYSEEIAGAVPILYGGSVKPENSGDLVKQADVDGALVGGASLDAASFASIIRSAISVRV